MQTATKNQIQTASIKNTLKEASRIYGEMLVSVYDTTSKKANELEKQIEALISGPRFKGYRDKYLELTAKMKRLFLVREYKITNIIVTVGRATFAQRLANDTTYTGIINYGALGTDNTAVTNADTTLGTELARKLVTTISNVTNTVLILVFFGAAEENGTLTEFGLFGEAASGSVLFQFCRCHL